MFGRLVNTFCFWLLASLAFVLFVLAVMRRPWDDYKDILKVEAAMKQDVENIQKRVAVNETKIGDLDPKNPNPLLVDRLAADILGWEFSGGREVPARRQIKPVQIAEPSPADDSLDEPADQSSPRDWIGPVTKSHEWQKMQSPQVQRLQLLMSAIAISMAFIFFGTPTKRSADQADVATDQEPEGF